MLYICLLKHSKHSHEKYLLFCHRWQHQYVYTPILQVDIYVKHFPEISTSMNFKKYKIFYVSLRWDWMKHNMTNANKCKPIKKNAMFYIFLHSLQLVFSVYNCRYLTLYCIVFCYKNNNIKWFQFVCIRSEFRQKIVSSVMLKVKIFGNSKPDPVMLEVKLI